MPTLLTNPRMHPALRARIVQSLHSDARSRAGGQSPLQGARMIRIILFFGVVGLSLALFVSFKKSRKEFRETRSSILARYRSETEHFDADYAKRLDTIDDFLRDIPETYEGDLVDESVKGTSSRLMALLDDPFVAVRGPLNAFKKESARRSTWRDGGPGPFVRCFLMPPDDVKESSLLRHLGKIYEPSAFQARFVNLDDAFKGQAFVESDFEKRLRSASLMRELTGLEATLDTAPLAEARAFSTVRMFVYVLDEPKIPGVASDFDGEAEHFMRVGVVDSRSGRPLFRARRRVDPDWISEKSRLSYSRQLDSCRLAYDLRAELDGRPGAAPER